MLATTCPQIIKGGEAYDCDYVLALGDIKSLHPFIRATGMGCHARKQRIQKGI